LVRVTPGSNWDAGDGDGVTSVVFHRKGERFAHGPLEPGRCLREALDPVHADRAAPPHKRRPDMTVPSGYLSYTCSAWDAACRGTEHQHAADREAPQDVLALVRDRRTLHAGTTCL
jgi:hypothetical protein